MSSTGPFEGTLLVNPLLGMATSYVLLRPFFECKRPLAEGAGALDVQEFLDSSNWRLEQPRLSSWMQGAKEGYGQELNETLHPHLELEKSMVHVPRVQPGDYVAWHCDSKFHFIPFPTSCLLPKCP